MQVLILFAHGSRDPAWRAPFDRVAARVRALRPDGQVVVAFLEFAAPSLPDAVADAAARGATAIRIVPMFLGLGGHLRHDMPGIVEAARARAPGVEVTVTPSLGEAEEVLQAMAAWLAELQPK